MDRPLTADDIRWNSNPENREILWPAEVHERLLGWQRFSSPQKNSAALRRRPMPSTPPLTGKGISVPGVTLGEILLSVMTFIRKYVVLTDEQATTAALWATHTHVVAGFDCTPYLQVTSATKRAGKTRLLEVLEPLVAKPWFTGRVSAAVLIRKVHGDQPTLLLDESDAAFKGDKEYGETLRGILNTGYRRSGRASLCVGQGANISYKDFSTFGCKAIAGIGELPDTIADRSIRIELKRRTSDEKCARWREREGHAEAEPIGNQLKVWGNHDGVLATLRASRPSLPSFLNDRQAEVWEPLLAIADLAGEGWPYRARRAAVALVGNIEQNDVVVELLSDIKAILAEMDSTDFFPTKLLLEKLIGNEDRPWATWRNDRPITPHSLARLLAPLGVHSVHLERLRGYPGDAFNDAIARYLPSKASERQNVNKDEPEPQVSNRHGPIGAGASKTADQTDFHCPNDAMTLEKAVLTERSRGSTPQFPRFPELTSWNHRVAHKWLGWSVPPELI
jgi:hypothetical protein